jgi:polysaccharide pyruvyl transferase WcaK-like protein
MVPVVNCRLSPKSRPCDHLVSIVFAALLYRLLPIPFLRKTISRATPWIAALDRADLVGDIRGGDSFSDIYGMGRFIHGFFLAWTVLLVKGRMVQFPQTFGPNKNPLARILARYLLKRSSVVIARDETSRQVAQALVGKSKEVWLSPDVAFSLEAVRPKNVQVDPSLEGPVAAGTIGINVNGLMYNGGYTRKNMFGLKLDYRGFLPDVIAALLAEHPGELWLVPHTYGPPESVESDPEACRKVREALPEPLQRRVRIVTGVYDAHEIKGVIGQFDFLIGSRMHACIAALSQGVPCVGVAYSRKFEGVFDSVGMHGWVVDGRTAENSQAVATVLDLYRKRNTVRESLSENAEKARARLKNVFHRIILSSTPS